MTNLTEVQAMEILSIIQHDIVDVLPLKEIHKEYIKEACNLGISALKTIEDLKGEISND